MAMTLCCLTAILTGVVALALCPTPRKNQHDEFCLIVCPHRRDG